MKKFLVFLAVPLCASAAHAAGIDSRAYSCGALHALLARQGFVFIGNPDFQDFVLADGFPCGGGDRPQVRSVPTTDNPECTVNYCIPAMGPGSGGG